MIDTFTKYCGQTLDEIIEASAVNFNPSNSKKINGKGTGSTSVKVNADKLVTKALTFFPNLKITVDEVQRTSEVMPLSSYPVSALLSCACAAGQNRRFDAQPAVFGHYREKK